MAFPPVVAGLEVEAVVVGPEHLAGTVALGVEVVVDLGFAARPQLLELGHVGAVVVRHSSELVVDSAFVEDSSDPAVRGFLLALGPVVAWPIVVRSSAVDAVEN